MRTKFRVFWVSRETIITKPCLCAAQFKKAWKMVEMSQ